MRFEKCIFVPLPPSTHYVILLPTCTMRWGSGFSRRLWILITSARAEWNKVSTRQHHRATWVLVSVRRMRRGTLRSVVRHCQTKELNPHRTNEIRAGDSMQLSMYDTLDESTEACSLKNTRFTRSGATIHKKSYIQWYTDISRLSDKKPSQRIDLANNFVSHDATVRSPAHRRALAPCASVYSSYTPHASRPCNITIKCWEGSQFQAVEQFHTIQAASEAKKTRNPVFFKYVLPIVAYICRL